jgi:RHS repeat-associated protein
MNMPGAPASFSGTNSNTHDTKLQLTNETSTRGGAYNFTSVYDGAGNPTTFKGTVNTFNNANQNTAWTHDGNGNPTSYKGITLTFDAENRMTAYGTTLTAGYQADGLRAWKQTSAGRTYYLYDGDKPVEELDGSGNKAAVMTFGPSGVLARTTATRTLLYSFDALGQMAQQIDAAAGTIVASYLFDAWGARQVNTNDPTAASDPYSGYNTAAGYITDWETGLQLLGHRYFDPATGRFLNRDPIGIRGGVNLYEYCGNSAAQATDRAGYEGDDPVTFLSMLKECLGEIAHLIGALATGTVECIRGLICNLIVNCLLDMAASIVYRGAIASIPYPDMATKFLMGCLVGMALSGFHWLTDTLCNRICKPNQDPNMCKAIANMLTGCVGGGVAAVLPGVGTIFAGAIDAGGEAVCKRMYPGEDSGGPPVPW